jgi:phage tail-like protein
MATDKDTIKLSYPLPVYNYRVTIDSVTLGFSEVSGLHVEYEPVTYKHGLSFATGSKIIPGMRQPIKLTLKRGIVQKDAFLISWLHDTYVNPFKSAKRDILIDLCDETGTPVVHWKVLGAFPTRIDAPTFDANSNEVAIETVEVIAQGMNVDYNP